MNKRFPGGFVIRLAFRPRKTPPRAQQNLPRTIESPAMTTATRPEQTPLAETATASVGDLIQRRRPLVLIGMMGAGKTRLGRQLSCLMGLPFHDSDHIM